MEDGGSPYYIGFGVLLLLVVLHAIFYGFLAALENQNENSLEKLAKEENQKALLLLRLSDEPAGSIHMIQFFITGLTFFAGAYIISAFHSVNRIIIFVCYWLIVVMAGIYAPTKIAAKKAESWGIGLCRIMHFLTMISLPFVKVLEFLGDIFVRICGVDPNENLDDVTEEEIISMVNEGHEQGVLLASEAEMIHNIFEFGDKEAKDIMTHRKNIIALDGSMTFSEAMDFMIQSRNSRFPVYIDDIDNIIGVLHIKEALQICTHQEYYDRQIKDISFLIRKAEFIPETRNINTLFKEMQSEKNHMVIVVDEYGQTAGIVAMEDILEEIVGNILDEHDEDEHMIQKQPDGSFLINGMADFEDVAKALDITVDEEDTYETLNGFLISKIDKIPNEDDRIVVETNGYCFKVLTVENKIIQKVSVTKLSEDTKESVDKPCQEPEKMIK